MRQTRSYYFLAVLLLPLFLLLRNPQAVESVHEVSTGLFRPVMALASFSVQLVVGTRDAAVLFWKTLQNKNDAEEKVARLETQLVHLQELSRENERLRKLLSLRATHPSKGVAARVIGWDPVVMRKVIFLDKGTSQGVRKDMSVVVDEGLVGRIIEAGASTSRALLLVDPDSRVSAITSESRAQGIFAGNGSSEADLIYLELDSGVHVDEEVLSSSIGGLFPKGLRIGKILSVEKNRDGLHLTAKVKLYARFSKLEEVLCLDYSPPKS